MSSVYNKMFDDYEKSQSTYSDLVKKTKEAELLDKQKRLEEFEQNAQVHSSERFLISFSRYSIK